MSFMFVKYGYGISLRRNLNVTVAHEDESFRLIYSKPQDKKKFNMLHLHLFHIKHLRDILFLFFFSRNPVNVVFFIVLEQKNELRTIYFNFSAF